MSRLKKKMFAFLPFFSVSAEFISYVFAMFTLLLSFQFGFNADRQTTLDAACQTA